jgi:type IV pilus assembly protein PilX
VSRNLPHAGAQRGLALVVVLLLLLVITLLGLAAMRGTVVQERMSGNAVARSIAFQIAEAGLREAESLAAGRPAMPTSGCANGLCAMPVGGAASAWEADNFWTSGSGFRTANLENDDIDVRYVIEDMGTGSGVTTPGADDAENPFDMTGGPQAPATPDTAQFYRVIVYSRTPNGAEVVLQSTYQVP